jgi:two-component system, NarL family, sensor histidine kinase DegS
MTSAPLARLRPRAAKVAKNPHFWIVVVVSAWLLFIYQVWPWPEQRFASGLWRSFSWLSVLESVVLHVEIKYHLFGSLFLIPIIYASLTLSWPGGIFAWFLALIWVLPSILSWSNSVHALSVVLLLLPVLPAAMVAGERRWHAREKRYFVEREQERQAYIARLVETQEAERRRIAQELHDETLQTLMVIANKADSLALSGTDAAQVRGNQWIKQEVLQTMDDLRRLSMNLRPSILDNFGLVSGVRWLVNNSNSQNTCCLDISVTGEERKMSGLSEVTVFRVVQEAINNIQRHARAETGTITLEFMDDHLLLEVIDDGVGFHPPERLVTYVGESKLGIIGMEQRVVSIGGRMILNSNPGGGTRIWAWIPYVASAQVVQAENA